MAPCIQILMSSYNGEKYIVDQLVSILEQKDVDVHVLLRDDGSKDKTIQLVKNIGDPRIEIVAGKNLGATNSFIELLNLAGDYDYYAFSDQDDVWDNEKLISGINAISDFRIPAIYSSGTRLVDADLNTIKRDVIDVRCTLGSAIVKNYATGCTIVFNKKLLKYLKEFRPYNIPHHDWWVNLVALSIGGVSVYDKKAYISYRQHDRNVVGAPVSVHKKWITRFKRFLFSTYKRDNMASQLLEGYDRHIDKETREILEEIKDYKKNKCRVIRDKRIRTNNSVDNTLFFLLLLFDKA